MISNNIEKLLRKLRSKKYRWSMELFVAEGPKVVAELLELGMSPIHLFSDTQLWENKGATIISSAQLKALSQLETSNEILAVFPFPKIEFAKESKITLVLDAINDPGNLGTIVRTADWFGLKQVFCTTGTTDIFNAKCVQSTMGSIARVKVNYDSQENILAQLKPSTIYVAEMDGENIFELNPVDSEIVLVMGSESHGPSQFWKENAKPLTIPKKGESSIESLNVSQACAILVSQLT